MLNHTYTSVKNANLVDCGKRTPIPSQPFPLLRDNYLGEYRTELDKKKVLANLGIATELSLEWEYIKGDIGNSVALMTELNSRTSYITQIGEFKDKVVSIIEGIKYLETIVGGEEEVELAQNNRLQDLENTSEELSYKLDSLNNYLEKTIEVNIDTLTQRLNEISAKVANITELIQVSTKEKNALTLITGEENQGLYVPDLSEEVNSASQNIVNLQEKVKQINGSLADFVTKDDLGGGDFNFVKQDVFDSYKTDTNSTIASIDAELARTVKTGEDGHVDTLFVNKISKNNDDTHIQITDSFEVNSGIPLDVRFVVENTEELCALSYKVCYPGMGVIVNSLTALYILRDPGDQVSFDQAYVSNIDNWKCPEDLVTVPLSREQYDALEEVNSNVFYYIYEDEITRTKEPKREDYSTDEEFKIEWQKWVESLKTLSQEYMSASWGVDIENKLSNKANQDSVDILSISITGLQDQIDSLSGGDSENSLSVLAERLTKTESDLDFLLGTEGNDEEASSQGKIAEIESSIYSLDDKLVTDYVTKKSITDVNANDNTKYIFVKESEYSKDRDNFITSLQQKVQTDLVETSQITLSNFPITSDGSNLLFNEKEVALIEDVPKIVYLSQAQYDALKDEEKDSSTYYYTTSEEIYVTQSKLEEKFSALSESITALSNSLGVINSRLDALENLHRNN